MDSTDRSSKFVLNAFDVFSFRLVKSENDINGDSSLKFSPEFCHQFFGEQETIFGYSNLKIDLLFTFCNPQFYLRVNFKEKADPEIFEGLEPDNFTEIFKKFYPKTGFYTNSDPFLEFLPKQHDFQPFGELLHVYFSEIDNKKREFHIYKVDSKTKSPKFVDFYERIETFSYWFIDAASPIDTEDDRWQFYITYEKYLNESQEICYGFVGYSSVYLYYAYPEHLKPRIGHFFILPPFHKCGHGFQLLQSIYNDLVPNPKILEIVAEDPADNFINLRDFVDCTNCQKLETFSPLEKLKLSGFSKDLIKETREKLKIGKKQARRVYEILRLKATNTAKPEEYRAYRLNVKQRLYEPFKKTQKDWAKTSKVLTAEEAATSAASMTRENVHLTLASLFEQTMSEYRSVLNRLSLKFDNLPEIKLANPVQQKSRDNFGNGKIDEINGKGDS